LFAEGVKDEDARNYGDALRKFHEVRAIRDTPAVRFRLAACLAALGRLRDARAMYTQVTGEKALPSREDAEIARRAREQVSALDARIPSLLILTDDGRAATVSVDGRPAGGSGDALPLDPGEHTVVAARPDGASSEAKVSLAEGARIRLTVHLTPTPLANAPAASPASTASPSRTGRTVAGLTTLALGVAMGASAVVLLTRRESEIAEVNGACPGGVCAPARRYEVETCLSNASSLGTWAIAAGTAGGALIAVGSAVLLWPSAAPRPTASGSAQGAYVGLRGDF
jgi:hypothetical protein